MLANLAWVYLSSGTEIALAYLENLESHDIEFSKSIRDRLKNIMEERRDGKVSHLMSQ